MSIKRRRERSKILNPSSPINTLITNLLTCKLKHTHQISVYHQLCLFSCSNQQNKTKYSNIIHLLIKRSDLTMFLFFPSSLFSVPANFHFHFHFHHFFSLSRWNHSYSPSIFRSARRYMYLCWFQRKRIY